MNRTLAKCVAVGLVVLGLLGGTSGAAQAEALVIAGSPTVAAPLKVLAEGYEQTHPDVTVQLHLDNGLDLRRTIAGIQNSQKGGYFLEGGPIHLVAPGRDELISRLEQKHYVVSGTTRAYAEERLVLVVPESLSDAPESFDELALHSQFRVAVADPQRSALGQQTAQLLHTGGLGENLKGRLDEASDVRGVLNHVLRGEADAGVLFMHQAVRERERLRIVAVADRGDNPIVHSMAMERYCRNRSLCSDFLSYIQSSEAQHLIRNLGYVSPSDAREKSGSP